MSRIYKTVKQSSVTLTELMIPSYANFGGFIHGGLILSLMDKVAYASASKHSGAYCVTVSVNGVDFLQPVEVGNLLSLKARVNYVGRTSMVVGIRVEAENVKSGKCTHTNSSYFTMVAKDENNNPTQVPGLVLETEDQVRRFWEAHNRKTLKAEYRKQLKMTKHTTQFEEELLALDLDSFQLSL